MPYDLIEDATENAERYKVDDTEKDCWVAVYACPVFLMRELDSIIHGKRIKTEIALSSLASYGCDRLTSSVEYRSWCVQYDRFHAYREWEPGDKADAGAALTGIKLAEDDNGEGRKKRNFRCPAFLREEFGGPVKRLGKSQSEMVLRFIMDGIRVQPEVTSEYKVILNRLVTGMYERIERQTRHLRNMLNGMGLPEAKEPEPDF